MKCLSLKQIKNRNAGDSEAEGAGAVRCLRWCPTGWLCSAPRPCRAEARGSLAESGTIISPLQRENRLGRAGQIEPLWQFLHGVGRAPGSILNRNCEFWAPRRQQVPSHLPLLSPETHRTESLQSTTKSSCTKALAAPLHPAPVRAGARCAAAHRGQQSSKRLAWVLGPA